MTSASKVTRVSGIPFDKAEKESPATSLKAWFPVGVENHDKFELTAGPRIRRVVSSLISVRASFHSRDEWKSLHRVH